MIGTQLKNMGAPVWSDDVSNNEVMVFMACTDAGPDQKKARRLIREQIQGDDAKKLWFESDCFQHQGHIMSGVLLAKGDNMITVVSRSLGENPKMTKFYSSGATLLNVWREIAHDIFFAWKNISPENAVKFAKKIPQRLDNSRWGAVYEGMLRLSKLPPHEFVVVLRAALAKKASKKRKKSGAGDFC